mgnify:CR=1 FL=1
MMKPALPLLLLSVFGSLLSVAKSPNFIIIYTDDLGYADTSVQMMDEEPNSKHRFINTPGIERLAALGARFNAGYSPTPTCTGSRLSIQFGKSSAQMQYRNVFDVLSPIQRPDGYDDETTIAEMLKAAGQDYATAMFGKGCGTIGRYDESGYDVTDENTPAGNGNGHGIYWNPNTKEPFPEDDPKRLHSLRKDSVAFIDEHAGKQPFFLMVSHYAAHIPFMATDEAVVRNRKRWIEQGGDVKQLANAKSKENKDILYAAMIEEMDMTVGGIIDALKVAGELDNTYIIFTSDNGGLSTSEGSPTSNLPLRGGKGWVYEGGIREPWIIRYPGVTKPGSVSSEMICSIDLLPTVASSVGSKIKHDIDGIDLTPALQGKQLDREALYWHYPHYSNQGGIPGGAIRVGDYKLFENYEDGKVSLYNLKKDIGETKDLSSSDPKRAKSMRTKLHAWYKEVNAQFLQPKGESKNPWRP